MLLFLVSAKVIVEVALLSLLGQGVVGLMAGQGRQRNVFYQLLRAVGSPFVRLMRWLLPNAILDRHVPVLTFATLALAWVLITVAKIGHCLEIGPEACR